MSSKNPRPKPHIYKINDRWFVRYCGRKLGEANANAQNFVDWKNWRESIDSRAVAA
jgi:predicted GH43/DUF377 family glycosyl hydrolase